MRLAAISVDLDEIPCYAAIYGLSAPHDDAARAIYRRALPRLSALFDDEGVRATFFAIGSDLDDENSARIADLCARGHEIANHSQNHFYDLTRRDRDTMREEVVRGADSIERACGVRPRGFRAPGYTITDDLFEALVSAGVEYDSSVFACPMYYGTKALALAVIAARGRTSRSILDDPRVLGAPADPYRIGRPYWQRGEGMLELPIGVTRLLRAPYYGTTVALSGPTGARMLTRAIAGRPLVNLELHGIDLADAERDGLEWLRPHQADLRRSAREKEAALRAAIATLHAEGYSFVTLASAARLISANRD